MTKPSDERSGYFLALLMVAAFLLVARQAWYVATGPVPPSRGRVAPAFSAERLNGSEVRLADHNGEVVLIDFWATWCPPCVSSMPALERVWQKHKGKGFVVLAVNIEPENLGRVRRFVKSKSLTFPIVIDKGTIAPSYGVYSYPTSVLVGRDGVVQHVWRGPPSEASLDAAVKALVGS